MQRSVLMTGATGLLGRYVLRELLRANVDVAVISRPSEHASAQDRLLELVESLEEEVGRSLSPPTVFDGDLNRPGLGLNESSRQWVETHCDAMLHNAASLQFIATEEGGEPYRSNVEGLRNVIELCRSTQIRKFHHVSTAYVCGERPGPIMECDLDAGQTFRNDYERSKFEAERIIRDASCFDSLTVYRPAIIAGDAQTGYTSSYHGLLSYYKFISVIARSVEPGPDGRRFIPIRVRITGEERRNVVPVDWVANAMVRIFNQPSLHGETYHLAPSEPTTTNHSIGTCLEYFSIDGVEFVGHDADISDWNTYEQAVAENTAIYDAYVTSDPVFDVSNTIAALPDLPCPELDRDMLHRFIEFGESDRWGKRQSRKKRSPKDNAVGVS
ncbi:SDR family oxidoreductase [Stratiformator vulcanicus]|uniref:Linear gramicidin synthase subunit D n=1 Tax=Stratiformator vulcanicus TaxID=2527980 RepID=A0A517QVV7_9PLAN|nr:SDR family oxidoreductase [Stratiformator vulcanicus]QDT35724.1 Linear gramicidin synthase subunit D [Stratiformator vulcanicus]